MDPYRKGYGTPPPPRKLDLGALAVRPLAWAVRLVWWALRLAFDFMPVLASTAVGLATAGEPWGWWWFDVVGTGVVGVGVWALVGVGVWACSAAWFDVDYKPLWWLAGRAIYRAAKRPVRKEE